MGMRDDLLLLGGSGAAITTPGRLWPDGIFVGASTGRVWPTGVTAFPIVERMAFDRPAVSAFRRWMVEHNAWIARGLGMYHRGHCQGVGNFGPGDVGGEDALIALYIETADYLAEAGRYLDLQVFADMQTDDCKPGNPLSQIDQPRFFTRVNEALAGRWNVLLGYGNQAGKNGFDPYELPPVDPSLYGSRGSGLEDELPFLPPYQRAEFHPGRGRDFMRKYKATYEMRIGETGPANNFQAVPGGIWYTEPIRIGEQDNDSACATPELMWDFAVGSKAWGTAVLYGHLETGRDLLLPGPKAEATFDAMVDGWTRIPADFALGSYDRGDAFGRNTNLAIYHHDYQIGEAIYPDGALRTYQLTVGSQCLVLVTAPGPEWTLRMQHGHVLQSWGYGHGRPDTVFLIQR